MNKRHEDAAETSVRNTVFYRSIMEQARDIILAFDSTGSIIDANHAAAIAYGYSIDELRSMRVQELRAPEVRIAVEAQLKAAQQQGILFRTIHMRKNGDYFPIEVSSRRFSLPIGEAVVSIARDITETVAIEQTLRESDAKHRQLYEELMATHEELNAVYEEITASEEELRQQFDELLTKDHEIRKQNAILQSLHDTSLGLTDRHDPAVLMQQIVSKASELLGTNHGFIYHLDKERRLFTRSHGIGIYEQDIGREIPINQGIVGEVYRTGHAVITNDYKEWRKLNPASAQFDALSSVLQVPLKVEGQVIGTIGLAYCEEGKLFEQEEAEILSQFANLASMALNDALLIAALERELQERKLSEQKIRQLAYYDTLTGLPNRVYFRERLAKELEKSACGESGGALLHLDLDELQVVNDMLGHSIGDELIAKVAQQIVTAAGEGALVARVAGDEFMILLDGKPARDKVARVAENVIRLIGKNYDMGGSWAPMSASMGVALYPDDGKTLQELLTQVDLALGAAKKSGKNTWRFCEERLQAAVYENMRLKHELRDAVERGELTLHYQPLVEARSSQVVGFEALLRWESPTLGPVSPSRFIPLAEGSSTIRKIGQWVLEEACRFARVLKEKGKEHLRVSVNVSPRQLVADDFVVIVRQAIRNAGIDPRQLEIEITESALIVSLEDSIRKLNELRAVGVALSLDDFGTGYSSLTYLRSLPVGTLKLDKSFIDQIQSDQSQTQFICSIINMAHILQLTVVAEGVETPEQLLKLAGCECDFIQGYVISRPVPQEQALLLVD